MKNKTILSVVVAVAVLAGGYALLANQYSVPTQAATASAVVELKNGDTYDLTASYVTKVLAGKEQKMLAYNGSIPGPAIKVMQGAEVTINFKNGTDLPALLHSHGVRMENAFDGSQTQQQEMKSGETFSYKLKFPDAGVFWYHPHVQEVYGQALGLYGAFIVAPKVEVYFPPVNRELPLFLADLPMANGKIQIEKGDSTHSLMGHYGNILLLNGQERPNLDAKTGEVVRLYVINAANARPFRFSISGLKLKFVGGDNGAYERATLVDSVVLGPSERAIVDVLFANAGTYDIQNDTSERRYSMGAFVVGSEKVSASYQKEFDRLQTNRTVTESIEPFRAFFDTAPQKQIALTLDMGGGMMNMQGMGHGAHMMPDGTMMGGSMVSGSSDGIEWNDTNSMMNEMSNTDSIKWKIVDRDTGRENMDIDWLLKKDQPVKIRIFNDPNSMHPMQHPIHFHGQRFLVIERDGVKQTNLVWKDTVLVKSGEMVDIVLDPSNPGTWMAHCHISEHLNAGMMFEFKVE